MRDEVKELNELLPPSWVAEEDEEGEGYVIFKVEDGGRKFPRAVFRVRTKKQLLALKELLMEVRSHGMV